MIQMVEMSKSSDAILDKHGFDLEHLGRGIEHYKLQDNKEIAIFKNMCCLITIRIESSFGSDYSTP